MPGCFTGISINSPISSLILGVPAITMSRLFRNSTHFIDSTGLTYTNFLRNPGPHPFQICNRIPKRWWCWLCFFWGGSNHNQFGGVFFQLDRHRSVPGFCWKLHQKPPRRRPWRDLQNRSIRQWAPETSCGFRRGTSNGMVFGSSDNGGAPFWKNGKQGCYDKVMVLMLPCSLIDRLCTLQHGSYSIFRKAVGLPCDHKAHLA